MDMKEKLLAEMEQSDFAKNNGKIMRTLNVLAPSYHNLSSIQRILKDDGIGEGQYAACLDFLALEGYILLPEMKATVEEMILDGSATYTEIVDYLQEHGYSLSVSSVCRYAQGYVENLQTLQIAQANFRNMLDELERYPDLDTTEALVRVASQDLMTALTAKKEEDWNAVSVDKLMNQISGLTRAVAYKKRVELRNKTDLEAGTDDVKTMLWRTMATEKPELYKQVTAYLDKKAQAAP